jgi:membrane peptidoglycan carboxypeptidase
VLRVRKIDDDARDPSIAIMRFEEGPEVGAVVMDPLSREIVALVGGVDFATNKFNHATQARRQTGSTFKPLVYAAGVEAKRLTPATILLDSPRSFPLPGGKVYSPKNSDDQWRGPIRVREAMGSSRNASAMLALELLEGPNTTRPEKARAFAQRLGLPAEHLTDNLTLALGSSEMTVMEMVNAYAVFASGGMMAAPRLITRVESTRNEAAPIEQRVEPVIAPADEILAHIDRFYGKDEESMEQLLSDISSSEAALMSPGMPMPKLCGEYIAAAATNTAARPTSEWKAATSCGSEVIWMRLAMTAPIEPPMARPAMIRTKPPKSMPEFRMVARMATPIPIMPYWLPLRDVSGCERPRSARMNRTEAAR